VPHALAGGGGGGGPVGDIETMREGRDRATLEPAPFAALTASLSLRPASRTWILYLWRFPRGIRRQALPLFEQRSQAYLNRVGAPDHSPRAPTTVFSTTAAPRIRGEATLRGRCEVRAEELPTKSAPKTRNVKPATSAVWRYLGKKVAPEGGGASWTLGDPLDGSGLDRPAPEKSGRYWARNRREAHGLDAIEANFSRLLQGVLVDAEGRPIALSSTGFHCAVGQIRDLLAGSDALREIVEALIRGMAGR